MQKSRITGSSVLLLITTNRLPLFHFGRKSDMPGLPPDNKTQNTAHLSQEINLMSGTSSEPGVDLKNKSGYIKYEEWPRISKFQLDQEC